jgi:hypothetical protein
MPSFEEYLPAAATPRGSQTTCDSVGAKFSHRLSLSDSAEGGRVRIAAARNHEFGKGKMSSAQLIHEIFRTFPIPPNRVLFRKILKN